MNCTQTEPLLNALADHALPFWQAFRVRRHLAACPTCMAEFNAIQRLDTAVRAWNDGLLPAALGTQIAAALPPSAALQVPRRTFPVRPAAVGLAGVAAAITAAIWFLPGQPGQPTIAFADVERAMQQVQTVSWEHTYRPNIPSSPIARKLISSSGDLPSVQWLRRSPPALATVYPNTGRKMLYDRRGSFELTQESCTIRHLYKDMIKKSVEDALRGFTTLPQAAPTATLDGVVRTTVTNMRESHIVFEGQNLIRFDRDVTNHWFIEGDGRSPFETDHNTAHVSTWVDPTTRRVVRNETNVFLDTHKGDTLTDFTEIEDHFQYDQSPPPGVFDWSPPKGAKVTEF